MGTGPGTGPGGGGAGQLRPAPQRRLAAAADPAGPAAPRLDPPAAAGEGKGQGSGKGSREGKGLCSRHGPTAPIY
ncbi:hypothetical protein DV515_00013231 [Chloebia gouldiae]|uniref:Uncharacterized protein n=1 Tax=Chloebia gouldiae TaxID=44316 RepID=A0A3L8S2X9_CHLGU|nr:hypothetical protein DV515_00013231 [Chloebia gouldiae]